MNVCKNTLVVLQIPRIKVLNKHKSFATEIVLRFFMIQFQLKYFSWIIQMRISDFLQTLNCPRFRKIFFRKNDLTSTRIDEAQSVAWFKFKATLEVKPSRPIN